MVTPEVPILTFARRPLEPGTATGMALDELVAYAREAGCSEEEMRERLEEALERYEEESDG